MVGKSIKLVHTIRPAISKIEIIEHIINTIKVGNQVNLIVL